MLPTLPSPPSPLPQSRMPSRLGRRVFLLQAERLLVSVHAPWKVLSPCKPLQSRQGLSQTHRTRRRLFFPEAWSSPRGHCSQGWWAGFWRLIPWTRSGPRARARAVAVGQGETHSVCRGTRERKGESPLPPVLTWGWT